MDLAKLTEKFPSNDLEWRVARSGFKKDGQPYAQVLVYITNRAIQNRLDEVCDPANWRNEYKEGPAGGVLCGISIKIGDEWVTKWDGAENTDIQPVKGGLSDSMKRAGCQWGIGRYLYDVEDNWAIFSDTGKYFAKIKDNQKKDHFYKWNSPSLDPKFLPSEDKKKLSKQLDSVSVSQDA